MGIMSQFRIRERGWGHRVLTHVELCKSELRIHDSHTPTPSWEKGDSRPPLLRWLRISIATFCYTVALPPSIAISPTHLRIPVRQLEPELQEQINKGRQKKLMEVKVYRGL